jgi:purine nucleosidase
VFVFGGKTGIMTKKTMGDRSVKIISAIAAAFLVFCGVGQAAEPQKIIIDTDIGDDIDDAFAAALALSSPEFQVLGFSAAFGDTPTRARMLDRLLGETGHGDIAVAVGVAADVNKGAFTQRRYAEGGSFARPNHPGSVDFILAQIRKYPGEITLVAIGPLPNIGALIDRDPATFKKLKRVVIMGGNVETLTDPYGQAAAIAPHAEWNIKNDIMSAQKLFTSGVPVTMLPLDSTANLKLHEVARTALFAHGTPMTDMLALTYQQWAAYTRNPTPTMYDPMTLASMLEPSLCPMTAMHIVVDDAGVTRAVPGAPNAQVCLHSDAEAFLRFYVRRVAK